MSSETISPKRWLKALKSGEYKKARGMLLNSKGGMCCLGVAAHLNGADLNWLDRSTYTCGVGHHNYIPFWIDPGNGADLAILNDTKAGYPIERIEKLMPVFEKAYRAGRK